MIEKVKSAIIETLGWYVVQVLAGCEQKVAETIHEQAGKAQLAHFIEDIWIPTGEAVEVIKGERVVTRKKIFPGYLLVKVVLTDEVWHLIRRIPRVSGFLGSQDRPLPLSSQEVDKLQRSVQESQKVKNVFEFEVGEKIEIIEGPFASFSGLVEEVNEEKERLKVSVMIFGRATPVELSFEQVKKI